MPTLTSTRSKPADDSPASLLRKLDICAKVLKEARRLQELGRLGAPVIQLIARGRELLDDVDEILVELDRAKFTHLCEMTGKLHRELESVQTAIALRRPDAVSGRKK